MEGLILPKKRPLRKNKTPPNWILFFTKTHIFSPLIASADSCSFFFLSLFLSAIFPFTCNFMWFIKLRASVGMCWVCAGVCKWAQVCAGMHGCARVCVNMHGRAPMCGMNFQNFFWRIESLHQRTLIRFLYEFFWIRWDSYPRSPRDRQCTPNHAKT